MVNLTRRQREFLQGTVVLQSENDGEPIHYSVLAEQLDVTNITAYNMLNTLERKGCVIASYLLPETRVGRSSIVFQVTAVGRQMARNGRPRDTQGQPGGLGIH